VLVCSGGGQDPTTGVSTYCRIAGCNDVVSDGFTRRTKSHSEAGWQLMVEKAVSDCS